MVRREPDGDDATEVTIAYVRQLEKRLADLEAFVAGKLPHDHDARYDGRYVNEAGDTMTDTLHSTAGVVVQRDTSTTWSPKFEVVDPDDNAERIVLYGHPGHGGLLRIFTNEFTRDFEFRVHNKGGGGSHGRAMYVYDTGDIRCFENFDVDGAKNALIDPEDPENPTLRYRFAAVEADEPGLLVHRRTVTIPTGGAEQTADLPPHWSRIAKDGDAMVTPLDDTRDRAPAAAAVDLSIPAVTVRGKPGDYRVWVAAARADGGVDGWTHEVEVTPDDEEV